MPSPSASDDQPKPWKVFLSASAKSVYVALFDKSLAAEARGEPTNQSCTDFRMVDDAVSRLIPENPLDKNYALAEPLSGLFRIRKGRIRIAWIADSGRRRVLVLFISETPRKEGDAQDPYKILERLVRAGYYQKDIDEWSRLTEPKDGDPIH